MNRTGCVLGRLNRYEIRELLLKSELGYDFKQTLLTWYDEAVKVHDVTELGLVISRPNEYERHLQSLSGKAKDDE